MSAFSVLLVALMLVSSVVCTVSAFCTMYLIVCYRALVPHQQMVQKLLALEGAQGELERQIDNFRKSYAGTISARKRKEASVAESPDNMSVEELRRLAAAGGD